MDRARVVAWLDEVIARTCDEPPALVGHVLGGAIGIRYAIDRPDTLGQLVLVDSLGLSSFRPSLAFGLSLLRFQLRPNERSFRRFMRHCAFDLDELRGQMGDAWTPFVGHALELARGPKAKAAGRMLRTLGLPALPQAELSSIAVPTKLIWGRHDRALRLRIAEAASARYGWPLRVIENAADDPARDQPAAFVRALHAALEAAPA